MGSGELDSDQTETRAHKRLPRFGPPEGKDVSLVTLLLWCYSEGIYRGGVDWI
jgi:hypothetical protein